MVNNDTTELYNRHDAFAIIQISHVAIDLMKIGKIGKMQLVLSKL